MTHTGGLLREPQHQIVILRAVKLRAPTADLFDQVRR